MGAPQDAPRLCQGRGQPRSALGCLWSGGADPWSLSLTLAGHVRADAVITILPQATVSSVETDPVVGGRGENREDVGQEAQHGAPKLKAPLHPHAKEAASCCLHLCSQGVIARPGDTAVSNQTQATCTEP